MKKKFAEVIGRACRLPGANSVSQFWNLLAAGKCSVSEIGQDRFSTFRYLHPSSGQDGKSYTFRAGVIDNIWGFDPTVFSLSPRETAQMDPQQRLLLMLVWEALEDAGLPASDLAGTNVGVFVGNSGSDHSNRFFFDPASSDSFMMTGNTTSLVSNRISYIFDLHGPSFTVDTACSSSLVALDLALKRLQSGEIDTAIVAGVNMLLSPFPFVGFSAASMLSPEGFCRPFDENANGYVRAEGAVVLILQRSDVFDHTNQQSFGRVIASGINSDGRTSGVALPSAEYQASLLKQVYDSAEIHPDQLAFIEAHGTGTRVGDPAEAFALGSVIGQRREQILPIGSVKSNVGHLEPASGLVGVLKALLALEHCKLPASLHVEVPNPDIPFDKLNLSLNRDLTTINKANGARYAGINNFGFGGTNVHVLISDAEDNEEPVSTVKTASKPTIRVANTNSDFKTQLLVLSAKSEEALREQVRLSIKQLTPDVANETKYSLFDWTNAIAWHRDLMTERLAIVCSSKGELCSSLDAYLATKSAPNIITASAIVPPQDPIFVFSGNGSQFSGMGQQAYRENSAFSESFDRIDTLFEPLSGWSLKKMIFDEELEERLKSTSVAQPLLFALQVALTEALKAAGLTIGGVIGHSVGEVAAAWASGALTLEQAVKVIYVRSLHQEAVAGAGRMAVIKLSVDEAKKHLEQKGFDEIEISAINTARSLTLSGPGEALEAFTQFAKRNRLPTKLLDINYPFHSAAVDPIQDGIVSDLKGMMPSAALVPFYSSVSGECLVGPELGAHYWWNNIRQPVCFSEAVKAALAAGKMQFVEIGPRPILKSYITEIARDEAHSITVIEGLDQKVVANYDPIGLVVGRAIANGISVNREIVFGSRKKLSFPLPGYAWQIKPYKLNPSHEAFEIFEAQVLPHPLLGQQIRVGDYIWDTDLDTSLFPYLADHKVDGKVILPGAAFAEMAIAAAQQGLKSDLVELRDMDLIGALPLSEDVSTAVRTRFNTDTGVVEIFSRKRLVEEDWQLHAKCRVAKIPGTVGLEAADYGLKAPLSNAISSTSRISALYATCREYGLEFGPAFRRMVYCERYDDEDFIEIVLSERPSLDVKREQSAAPYALHPLDFDASFHGLNCLYEDLDSNDEKMAFIPVRFGALRIYSSGTDVRSARIHIIRSNERGIQADINMFADDGSLVAVLRDGRFRSSALVQRQGLDSLTYSYKSILKPLPGNNFAVPQLDCKSVKAAITALTPSDLRATDDGQLLLQAAARRGAYDVLQKMAGAELIITSDALTELKLVGELSSNEIDKGLQGRTEHRRKLFWTLCHICAQAGYLVQVDEDWHLTPECELPDVSQIFQLLLSENSSWVSEVVMLNHALERIPDMLDNMVGPFDENLVLQDLYSTDLYDQHFSSSPLTQAHVEQLHSAFLAVVEHWPAGRPLRVLEFGVSSGALTKLIHPIVEKAGGFLVAADTNKLILDRLQILFVESVHFRSVLLKGDLNTLSELGPFDLVISANGIQFVDKAATMLPQLPTLMAKNSLLVASLSDNNVFQDLAFGLASNWFDASVDPAFPMSSHSDAQDWCGWLKSAGLKTASIAPFKNALGDIGLTGAHLLMAAKSGCDEIEHTSGMLIDDTDTEGRQCILITDHSHEGEQELAQRLSSLLDNLKISHQNVVVGPTAANDSETSGIIEPLIGDGLVDVIVIAGSNYNTFLPMEAVSSRLQLLGKLLRETVEYKLRLWIIAPGGFPIETEHWSDPVQSSVWAYGRTAINEYSDHDIRLIDFAESLSIDQQVDRLAAVISKPGDEKEILLEPAAVRAARVSRGCSAKSLPDPAISKAAACKLFHPRSGSFDRLHWIPAERQSPKTGEVEIEVVATGLNFRDVMWAQGLLPEEALEEGFAGPTLGFECSGRIVAIGEGITRFKIGDPVMALAPACFASHVTVVETGVSSLPGTMDLTAAATMPVAFLTSYYALNHLAQLEENEWVLIHGAAGAVGLAAIQVAKWRGARIIATAGTAEKREFLKMLGADHVLDTRSLDFVDQVRAITRDADGPGKEGVDVVLNSLFGEAMERSLELVRPFGRFLELGKRDFYGNTKIGLRPFRRNISYFGIDADQLLNHQPKRARRLFTELVELFETGQFTLLPYRLYESTDIVDAFRLMQRSGHIGKIVVKAPKPEAYPAQISPFKVEEDGHHIIIGGLGGFGLETARWLLDKGATSIILTGRTATVSQDAKHLQNLASAKGCQIKFKSCDVTNEADVQTMLKDLRTELPIKGIIHSAMVLKDSLIANLTDEQIDEVLAPKVKGGYILDRQTRKDALDYFWLFSSVSVLIGNPGQAHYVAANSYLDGLARQRRQQGLPALAVGWGAITDVGILSREIQTAETLAKTTGGMEFKARQALDHLAKFIGQTRGTDTPATITIAPMNWSFAGANLAILKTPAYAQLAHEASQSSSRDQTSIDIGELIDGLDDVAAREVLAKILAQEVAVIFRMPVEEIHLSRSLTDIGMDSLMGMELRTAAQQKLDIEIPMGAIADGTTINDIAANVITRVRGDDQSLSFTEETLLHQHVASIEEADAIKKQLTDLREIGR